MDSFDWKDEFNTGIPEIDRQHRELFKKMDQLSLGIYGGKSREHLKEMMQFLDDYVESHFAAEEELLMSANYPDYGKHREQHSRFRLIFASFLSDFEKKGGDSYLAIRLEKEIRSWWETHILHMDLLYVPHIIS